MSKFFPLKLSGVSSFHIALLSVFWLTCISTTHLSAQEVPGAINYQAIVRDSETFLPISDRGAYVSVEFLDGPDGDVLYREEFSAVQTGKAGLINLSLGQGNPLINTFEEISWETGNVWLRLSVDIGNGLNILQETPFNTVPYAFYAQSSGGSDGDIDPTNELIQSIDLENSLLEITEGDSTITVDLSTLINDDDSDPDNERIDSLDFDAETNILYVYESGNQFEVTLNPGELTSTLQDLSYDEENHILTITELEDATSVNLTPYLDNTDAQTLSLENTVITISGSESSVDLIDLLNTNVDLDPDPSNELQDIELNGNELSITNNPLATPVDLSSYLDNTDNQDLTLSGSTLSLSGDGTSVDLSTVPGIGDDADANPSNELQDIELIGNELSITNNPLATPVDLSQYDNSELQQNHIFIGNGSNEAEEVAVTGDLNLAGNGEITVTGLQSVDISNTAPTDGQVLIYDAIAGEWQPEDPTTVVPGSTVGFYNIDPLDFRELTDPGAGADLNDNNAIKFYNEEAPFAFIRNSSTFDALGAPVHLPHGATVTRVRVYFRDVAPGFMQFRLVRKNITTVSIFNQVMAELSGFGAMGNVAVTDNSIVNEVIDNSLYNYRFIAEFTYQENNNTPDITFDMEQRIYGVVISYTIN